MKTFGNSSWWGLVFLAGMLGCSPSNSDASASGPDRASAEPKPADCGVDGHCGVVWQGGAARSDARLPIAQPFSGATISLKALQTDEVLFQGRPDRAGGFRIEAKPGKYRLAVTVTTALRWLQGAEILANGCLVELVEVRPGQFTQGGYPGEMVEVLPGQFTQVEIRLREGES